MMTKPQALFLAAPFAGYALGRWGVRRAVPVGIVAVAVAAATWLPFLPYGGVADYLHNLDYYQNGLFPILSVRAWNPWWLVQEALGHGEFVADSLPWLGPFTARHLGIAMTAVAESHPRLVARRRRRSGSTSAWRPQRSRVLSHDSMHERYAYAALVLLAPS